MWKLPRWTASAIILSLSPEMPSVLPRSLLHGDAAMLHHGDAAMLHNVAASSCCWSGP